MKIHTKIFAALGISLSLSGLLFWFNDYFYMLLPLFKQEEYSYLIATFLILSFITVREKEKLQIRNHDWGILTGSLAIILSLYIYVSTITTSYSLQFGMLAVILWLWGTILLLFGVGGAGSLKKPLFLTLFLIPVPRAFLDISGLKLSGITAEITSWLTGAKIVETGTGLMLTLTDTIGQPIHFLITIGCSGIIGITGILAIIPLIIYFASETQKRKNILLVPMLIALSAIIMYVSNIFRITMVLEASRYFGVQTGLRIFHSTPSLLTAIITAVIIILVMKRIGLLEKRDSSFSEKKDTHPCLGGLIGLILILTVLMGGIGYFIQQESASLENTEIQKIYSIDELLGDKSIILNTKPSIFNIKYIEEKKDWESTLGIPKVYLEYVGYKDTIFMLYLEISGQQGLFHGWPVCLTYQGYKIIRSWIEPYNITDKETIDIRYLVLEKNNLTYLMAYTITVIPADYGGVIATLYIKASFLSTPYKNEKQCLEKSYPVIKEAIEMYLNEINKEYGYYKEYVAGRQGYVSPQNIIGFFTGILLATNILFIGLLLLKNKIGNKK